MRRYVWVLAILIVGLVSAMLAAGCGKKQQASAPASGVTASAPSAEATVDAPKSSSPADQLKSVQGKLTSYEMSSGTGGQKMTQWMKIENGKPLRIKSDMGAMGWSLLQFDNKVQYTFDPKTQIAMKMPLNVPKNAPGGNSGIPGSTGASIPKITSGSLDGADCWVSESNVAGAGTIKAWMDKDYGLARQVQMGDKVMKFSYDKINSVPDSEFELPAGTKVQEMPAVPTMPQGMPKGMKMPTGH